MCITQNYQSNDTKTQEMARWPGRVVISSRNSIIKLQPCQASNNVPQNMFYLIQNVNLPGLEGPHQTGKRRPAWSCTQMTVPQDPDTWHCG